MIPGRFHAETFAPFDIEPGETVVIPLVDQDGRPALSFVLPIDDTDFEYEISDVSFDPIATNRPTRIIVDPYRLGKPGTLLATGEPGRLWRRNEETVAAVLDLIEREKP